MTLSGSMPRSLFRSSIPSRGFSMWKWHQSLVRDVPGVSQQHWGCSTQVCTEKYHGRGHANTADSRLPDLFARDPPGLAIPVPKKRYMYLKLGLPRSRSA